MKRPAFTVLELLFVVMIITLLTTVFTLDFSTIMNRNLVKNQQAEVIAVLQQALWRVQAGELRDGELLCEGLMISAEKISRVTANFDSESDELSCSKNLQVEALTWDDRLVVTDATVGGVAQNDFYIFRVPPSGTLRVTDAGFNAISGAVDFAIALKDASFSLNVHVE